MSSLTKVFKSFVRDFAFFTKTWKNSEEGVVKETMLWMAIWRTYSIVRKKMRFLVNQLSAERSVNCLVAKRFSEQEEYKL